MRLRGAMPALVALLVAAACGSPGDTTRPDDAGTGSTSPPPTAAPAPLECEEKGYPCSLDEVPSEILLRSDELADEVLDLFAGGSSMDGAVAFLQAESDVAEVESDEDAVRFRVDGGRGTWVLRASALATRSTPGPPTGRGPVRAGAATFYRVVGDEEVEEKRALVLSPYEWDFGPTEFFDEQGRLQTTIAADDGGEVAEMLSKVRGYEGRVEFYANTVPFATDVNVDSFRDWDAYDVVHVATHGTRLCKGAEPSSSCRGAVFAGMVEEAEPGDGIEVYDVLKRKFKQKGVELGKTETTSRGLKLEIPSANHVLLTAEFFHNEYRSGLDNTFVFFNACELLGVGGTDLIDAVKGTTSVVAGWTDTVDSQAAYNAALALYEDLGERGFAVLDAVERLGILALDTSNAAELVVSERASGGDLRIRDVVHALDPNTGTVLISGDGIGFEGTADDGEPDRLPFSIDVDGIAEEEAPSVVVHLSVDGDEIFTDSVTAGTEAAPGDWTVSGVADLGFDVEEGMEVTLRAWVDLFDDLGMSDHEVLVGLTGSEEPIMGRTWEIEFTETNGHRDIGTAFVTTGTLRLEFDATQAPDEPIPRYRVVGGHITHEAINQTDSSGCTYTADAVTYEITPDLAPNTPIALSPEFNPYPGKEFARNYLYFDTTTTPIRYYGNIITEPAGPETHITDCPASGANEVDITADLLWFSIPPRSPQPLTDRGIIEGFEYTGSGGYSDREWTARRIG